MIFGPGSSALPGSGLPSMTFRGLYPVLQTPFDDNGGVDFDSLRRLIRHVGECGVQGIVFPGFASEWWRLTDAEVLECSACVGAGAVLNVTAQATASALRAAREFARMRPQALMILPPFVVPAPVERHISAVLEATELPCIVQDSAGLTGVTVSADALATLATEHSNLAGIKVDRVPTGPAITCLRSVPALSVLSYLVGYSGVQMLDAVRRGAGGLMGACGHVADDRRMIDALLAGEGYAEYARLVPLLNFEMQSLDMVIAVHKQILFEAGIIATPLCRAPCRAIDETHRSELHMHLEALHQ